MSALAGEFNWSQQYGPEIALLALCIFMFSSCARSTAEPLYSIYLAYTSIIQCLLATTI